MDEAYIFKQTLMVTRTEKFAQFFPGAINLWRLTLGERLSVRDFIAQTLSNWTIVLNAFETSPTVFISIVLSRV